MTFSCQLCGECCSTMGEIIEIRDEVSPFLYRIGYTTTGEERMVTIDPDKRDLFANGSPARKRSLACPFLREAVPGKVICTVHNTRPELCRQYSCFRLLVLDSCGNRIGKVIESTRHLRTMDHTLREVWEQEITNSNITNEYLWEKYTEEVLVNRGFQVIK